MRLGPLHLVRLRRLRISLDPSLLFGLGYLGWWFFERYQALARLEGQVARFSPGFWAPVLVAGALLGLLAHELGHVLFARLAGGRMQGLTLSLLGSRMTLSGGRRVELVAALGGPLASLLLGAGLVAIQRLLDAPHPDVSLAIYDLARLQLLLGAVNLLPVPPFDAARFLDPGIARKVGLLVATALVLTALATSRLPLLFVALCLYAGPDVPRAAPATLSTRPV